MELSLVLAGALAIAVISAAEPVNICSNPGFEQLNPAGDNFPLNWSRSQSQTGQSQVTIDKDAHGGSIAIRMSSKSAESATLNSSLIPGRIGTARLHYKAIRSAVDGANLHFDVIPMDASGVEVGGGRVVYTVPKDHVGDGQWHEASLNFDYRSNSSVAGVLIAPRVNELPTSGEGEWLVDDASAEAVKLGPQPVIEALWISEPVSRPGQQVKIVAEVTNTGDEPVPGSQLRLSSSADTTLIADAEVDPLEPGDSRRFVWGCKTKQTGKVEFKAEWAGTTRTKCGLSLADGQGNRDICMDSAGQWRFMPKPLPLQLGNDSPLTPLKTLKSSELPDSHIGITAHLPRGKDFEVIFEPEHLIDGNWQTSWSGRAHATPCPGSTDWFEVKLPRPQRITKLNLVPYHRAEGFPVDFTIKVHVGGDDWKTVVARKRVAVDHSWGLGDKKALTFELEQPVTTGAIRVEVTRFTHTASFFTDLCAGLCFRLSEFEAIDDKGENVALASKGAKATTPFTFRSYYNSRDVIAKTYHELYDMGIKWNRVGQWGDLTAWAMVEREKGKYYIDPTTDQAITDSVKNGVNILYTLAYGNPLYEETPWLAAPGPVWRHGHPFTGDGGPTKPESIQGFVNYARFVAQHFKGRVHWYEIWNEENSWAWYGSPPDAKAFGTLVREAAKAVKEVDPTNKVMIGGTAALAPTFISQALEEGAGPYLDAVGYHPYGSPYAEIGVGALDVVDGKQVGRDKKEFGYDTTEDMLAFLRKTFGRFNPNLQFWANEWNAISSREDSPYKGISEMSEAKQVARFCLVNTLLDVHCVWWSLVNENTLYEWAVLRTGELTRKPCYYAFQAMSTLLAGASKIDSPKVSVTGDAPELRCEVMKHRDGSTMVAVWSAVQPNDDHEAKRVSLRIDGRAATQVDAVDTVHSLVQKLEVKHDGSALVIEGLLVPDYPVIVRVR